MADAKTKYLDHSAIPVIDIAELYSETNLALRRVADEMRRAAESIGFSMLQIMAFRKRR